MKRKANNANTSDAELLRVSMKERDPNWNQSKTMALMSAKCIGFHLRSQMSNKSLGWNMVGISVNLSKGITCYHSQDACKYKWQQPLLD